MMHERLEAWKEQLETFGSSAFVIDPDLRLVWISNELKAFLDEEDDSKIGIGRPLPEAWTGDTWMRVATPESQMSVFLSLAPFIVWAYGRESKPLPELPEPMTELLGTIEPQEFPDIWTWGFDYVDPRDPDVPPYPVYNLVFCVRDKHGSELGYVGVGNFGVRPNLLALLARGDVATYERMARLIKPGTRQAAILFCDLKASAELSRRLSSAAYFKLIRRLWTAIDDVVASNAGIVGKHAGDGASAFFLVEDLGSSSAAAAAAVRTARTIHELSVETFKEVLDSPCIMRIGLHWGGTLYMGQLVPGGRLDVTALGDEVNECARIQDCAGAHQTLASKQLLEQLNDSDASSLGLELDELVYETVAETAGATDKARAEVGSIAVTTV